MIVSRSSTTTSRVEEKHANIIGIFGNEAYVFSFIVCDGPTLKERQVCFTPKENKDYWLFDAHTRWKMPGATKPIAPGRVYVAVKHEMLFSVADVYCPHLAVDCTFSRRMVSGGTSLSSA